MNADGKTHFHQRKTVNQSGSLLTVFIVSSALSRSSRLLPQPAEESDAGQGGRRRPHRVPAQDVSLGGGLLEEGQRAAAGKQQVSQRVGESVSGTAVHWLTQSA